MEGEREGLTGLTEEVTGAATAFDEVVCKSRGGGVLDWKPKFAEVKAAPKAPTKATIAAILIRLKEEDFFSSFSERCRLAGSLPFGPACFTQVFSMRSHQDSGTVSR